LRNSTLASRRSSDGGGTLKPIPAVVVGDLETEKRGLTIDTEIERKAIVTDPLLWTAILNNLLGNAVSHAPRGAHVFVEASPDAWR
jgi:signal transduction histidine kinase